MSWFKKPSEVWGDVAEVVECMFNKCKDLSSKACTTKKKKEEGREEGEKKPPLGACEPGCVQHPQPEPLLSYTWVAVTSVFWLDTGRWWSINILFEWSRPVGQQTRRESSKTTNCLI
jgi:hypothetical protein